MAGPTTPIEIISAAAILLGREPLTTIDTKDKFGVSAQMFYDLLVDSEIAQNHWKFCKKEVQLSKVAGFDPDFSAWNAAYDLPADFLALVRLDPNINYQIFGKRIYTANSTASLKMEYTYNTPVTFWSAPFREYIVYALAAKLAISQALDANLAQALMSERNLLRSTAMYIDAQNSPNVPIQRNILIDSRRSGYGISGSGRL